MMRNILFLFLLSLSLFSCDSDNDSPEQNNNAELYSFNKIEYFTIENGIDSYFLILPPIEYSNGSGEEQKYPYDPLEKYPFETSHFISDNKEAFIIEGLEVNVPIDITNNEISLGSKKWKYNNVSEQKKSDIILLYELSIAPKQKLTVTSKLFYKKYTVNYKLYLDEINTGKQKVIEGQWIGNYPTNCEIETQSSNL